MQPTATVLVYSDNTDTREVIRFMLEAEGARVMTASTGEDGLRLAIEQRPHLHRNAVRRELTLTHRGALVRCRHSLV